MPKILNAIMIKSGILQLILTLPLKCNDEDVIRICLKLLRKAPRDRYQSAREILEELESNPDDELTPPEVSGFKPPMIGRSRALGRVSDIISALSRSEGIECRFARTSSSCSRCWVHWSPRRRPARRGSWWGLRVPSR